MKSVVVTGSSTGIGLATAAALVGRGYRVFGSVRAQIDAERVRSELGDTFVPVIFDVTDRVAVFEAADRVRESLEGRRLDGLVNNAGIAVTGPLLHVDPEEVRLAFEVNVMGVLTTVQAFAPLLGVDRNLAGAPGRIVNISSVAGKMPMPFVGPYAISKHGLEALSGSLRREMLLYGIDVIVVGPGAVKTPIWSKARSAVLEKFEHTDFVPALRRVVDHTMALEQRGLPAERIAKLVVHVLAAARPRARYAVVRRPVQDWLVRHLPPRWVDGVIGNRLGLLS